MSENLFCPVVRLLLLVLSALAGGASHAQSASDEGTSPLVLAILGHDREAVERVLVEDKDALERRFVDRTPLMWAAVDGDTAIVAKLLGRKASVTATDARGYTSLMLAIEAGKKNHAILLLGAGSSLDHVAIDGHHPASLASRRGWVGFGSGLRKDYGKLSASEADGILLRAAETGDTRLLRFAIQQGARGTRAKAANGWTPLMLAALGGHEKAFDVLATKRHSLSVRDRRITVVDGISVVDALLAGDAKRNPSKLATMARVLKTRSGDKKGFDHPRFGIAIRRITTASDVVLYFGQPTEPVPASIALLSKTNTNWQSIQLMLRRNGLYDGAIDGVAGRGTLAGLFSLAAGDWVTLIEAASRVGRKAARSPEQGQFRVWSGKINEREYRKFDYVERGRQGCPPYLSLQITKNEIRSTLQSKGWTLDLYTKLGGREPKTRISLFTCSAEVGRKTRILSRLSVRFRRDWTSIRNLVQKL